MGKTRQQHRKGARIVTLPDNTHVHPLLSYFHHAVGPVIALGGFGVISSYFWVGVSVTYFGLLVCVAEIWFNPLIIRPPLWLRLGGTGIVLCLMAIFSIKVPFISTPLQILTHIDPDRHLPGDIVSGIKWRSGFTPLRISLANPTGEDYKEVDIVLEPDESIANISQVSTLPGVSFIGDATKEQVNIEGSSATMPSLRMKDPGGSDIDIPITQVLTPLYRVRCQLLPKHSELQLLMAVAGIGTPPPGLFNMSFESGGKRIILVPTSDLDKVTFITKRPTRIKVYGTYGVKFWNRKTDETVEISGFNKGVAEK